MKCLLQEVAMGGAADRVRSVQLVATGLAEEETLARLLELAKAQGEEHFGLALEMWIKLNEMGASAEGAEIPEELKRRIARGEGFADGGS